MVTCLVSSVSSTIFRRPHRPHLLRQSFPRIRGEAVTQVAAALEKKRGTAQFTRGNWDLRSSKKGKLKKQCHMYNMVEICLV